MSSRQLDEEAIFHVARNIDKPGTRAQYLDQICAGDLNLRQRVEALLEVHEKGEEFLKSAPAKPVPTDDFVPISEQPGMTIGRYRLMEQIGEGGMGVVFVAEQQKPIQRKVALKVIKPGMHSKAVVARFEAERQALALMDHSNIARVLDAGTTETGLPYFVMELVRGVPITDYCDQNKLTIRERLELFIPVCQAIQHAHQKGIIHRDIKPTNVLVTLHDGKPVPKVIDFGVAKALHQRLTEKTIYTSLAQAIGTPLYMSPEQAELSGLDIDTRSDVYSLGVLLYELLTGTTPFDKQTLEKAGDAEIRRIIREQEPLKPSRKISSLGETATAVSSHRGTDPRGLFKLVMGDLDVIAMKALEKDRSRRYDTASGIAADVQRFLSDEPIVARSPSLAYRFTKFARRNRVAVVTSALVLASLVGGIVATSLMAREKQRQADIAERALLNLRETLFDQGLTHVFNGKEVEARDTVERLHQIGADDLADKLHGALLIYSGKGREAVELLTTKVREKPTSFGLWALLTHAYDDASDHDNWFKCLRKLQTLGDPVSAEDYLFAAQAFDDPGVALKYVNRAFELRKSPITLLLRGRIKADYSIQYGNLDYAHEGVRDVKAASVLLDENAYIRIQLLATPLLIANAYRASKPIPGWEGYLAEAERAATAIERQTSKHVWELFYLAQYYRARNDRKREKDLYQEVLPEYWTDHFTFTYLARVVVLGEKLDKALEARIMQGRAGPVSAVGLAFLLAMDGEVEKALDISREYGESSDWIEAALPSCDVYNIAGKPEEAKEMARKLLIRFKNQPFQHDFFASSKRRAVERCLCFLS